MVSEQQPCLYPEKPCAQLLRKHPLVTDVHYINPDDVQGNTERAAEARLHFSQARGGGAGNKGRQGCGLLITL